MNLVKITVTRDGEVVASSEGQNFVDPRNTFWRNQTRSVTQDGTMRVTLLRARHTPKEVVDIPSWTSSDVIVTQDQSPLGDAPYFYWEGDYVVLAREFEDR